LLGAVDDTIAAAGFAHAGGAATVTGNPIAVVALLGAVYDAIAANTDRNGCLRLGNLLGVLR
jgi:hypothetical protein